MNEAETRAELIDPKLTKSGWNMVEGSRVLREFKITDGRIQIGGTRSKQMIADYVLIYKNRKIAVIEAKSVNMEVGEGVAQAKLYATKLNIDYTYATNGKEIYQISIKSGRQELVDRFPTPDELWSKTYSDQNEWKDKFDAVPFESIGGTKGLRYYQEIAVANVLNAIAEEKQRILLTLATGTGKTFIAFQIAWKLYQTRWNLKRDGSRRPRILFLADRNILANQAFNSFSAFPDDALVRITPKEISKKGSVPMNGSIFFTIFQTFMTPNEHQANFGAYQPDFFDFIIVDECHRGGANDEGNWRGILEHFSPAVQLGLTATPKRNENADTYKYFGEPVYSYSLSEGINDGFLTPFKVKRIKTTLDEYIFTSDDKVIEGDIEEGKLYTGPEFNRSIVIVARERARVKIFLNEINQSEKTIVFCANQEHAALIRDLICEEAKNKDPFYCVRITANDGEKGEEFLRTFQDNQKSIPTILTTSQKLSTGVDARNVRNIVLLRPVNSMIEFKQIVGRGTRLYDDKYFFTIYDYDDAYQRFLDKDWDGDPVCSKCGQEPCVCSEKKPIQRCAKCGQSPCVCKKDKPEEKECPKCGESPCICKKKVKVKLRDGKEREIKHMISTSFWGADGKPISVEEFMNNLYGTLPSFFQTEDELKKIWSDPITRKSLLDKLAEAGYGKPVMIELQKLVDAEQSDLFDVLEFISFNIEPITRDNRVLIAKPKIFESITIAQKEFLEFVLFKYIDSGVEELEQTRLANLIELKYHSLSDGLDALGGVEQARNIFIKFQQHLYC